MCDELDSCCIALDSNKITDRKKAADTLRDIINSSDIINNLNSNDPRRNWDYVYTSVQRYIRKEGEKLYQDEIRQIGAASAARKKSTSHTLLLQVIAKANSGDVRLSVSKLIDSVFQCYESSYLKKYFGEVYLQILVKHILSVRKYWKQIDDDKWQDIYSLLKAIYKSCPETKSDKQNIIQGLYLTIKYGCKYSSLSIYLRQEFSFIKEICTNLKNNDFALYKHLIQLLICFCAQLAKDCRMASCKLGEELMPFIFELYNPRDDHFSGIKRFIFDFFLLQLRLHHPNGVIQDNDSAYAYDWSKWKYFLKQFYSTLYTEVELIRYRSITTLESNFLALFVDVARQVYDAGITDITQVSVLENVSDILPTAKRPRLNVGFDAIISELRSKEINWPWLCILDELLNNYPDIIQPSNFLTLLEILASLQLECKDFVTRDYLYKLLSCMVQAQDLLAEEHFDLERLDLLWTKVWETTLRSVGLNQNEAATHKLLQTMLHHKKILQPLSLLPIYTSGVLNITKYSIQTLHILCKTTIIPAFGQSGIDMKSRKYLINFVLGLNSDKILDSTVYCDKISAEILVGLVMKTWPYETTYNIKEPLNRKYNDIEYSYTLSAFENGLLVNKSEKLVENSTTNNYLVNANLMTELTNLLNDFSLHLCKSEYGIISDAINLVNGIILILNLLSELISLNICDIENLSQVVDTQNLFDQLNNFAHVLKTIEIIEFLKQVEFMFSLNVCEEISALIRQQMSVDFLKIIFDLLNMDEPDAADDMDSELMVSLSVPDLINSSMELLNENSLNNAERMQLMAMKILSAFCCVPTANEMNQKQKHALDILAEPEFDPEKNVEFQMTVHLLKALLSCKPGSLSDTVIEFILNSLQTLMEKRYEEYQAASLLLDILKDTFCHINLMENNREKQSNSLALLKPFYDRRKSYDISVSVTIINCIGELLKINPEGTWADSSEFVANLLNFLKCVNHEVRLIAIKNMLNIFANTNTTPEILKRQKLLFQTTCKMILESFSINNNLNAEQAIDESANRTASALHTFAALIVVNPIWRKEALFEMLKLVDEKKFNTDLIQKVFLLVGKYLDMDDANYLLELNANYLIFRWNKSGKKLNEFPFTLFKCENDVAFFTSYVNIVVPIILHQDDTELLRTLCVQLSKSLTQVIKDSYPNIIAQYLPIYSFGKVSNEFDITNNDILVGKRLFRQLETMLGENHFSTLFIEMLDEIYINLLKRLYDSKHLISQFDFKQILPEPDPPFYQLDLFNETIKYIEVKSLSDNSIIAYCIKNCPQKLEHILLEATIDLHNSPTIEDKLIALLRYTVLIDYIIPELQTDNKMRLFLMRTIIYNLMNLMKLFKEKYPILAISVCRYFKTFCSKTLMHCPKIFEKFLVLIITTLVPIAKLDTKLSCECIVVLDFLLVENSKYLYSSIGKLDPFPINEKFANIQRIYEKIKYGNDSFSLEQEIIHFLNAGSSIEIGDRSEGLQHLRSQLAEKKDELNELYAKLEKLRGFCDDCEQSILHQLICMLVKLTTSFNPTVRLEAARCLGELGSTDLTTLVLQPEKILSDIDENPLEFVIKHVVHLLSQYLVSQNVRVAKTVSEALYSVLACCDQKIFKESDHKIEIKYLTPFLHKTKKSNIAINFKINEDDFRLKLNYFDLWCPTAQCLHSEWIITLVSELLKIFPENCFLRHLVPVCQIQVEFAEELLPMLIYLILCQRNNVCSEIISKQIQQYFANHWQGTLPNRTSLSQASTDSVVVFNRASVQCMLNVIHFIRLRQNIPETKKALNELHLNYLHVAQAAQFCSAYFTSILYAELWCYDTLDKKPYDSQNTLSTLTRTFENESSDLNQAFENMIREGYKKIGDIDAMHGCGISYILNPKSRIDYYKNLGQWDQVILHYDSNLGYNSEAPSSDLTTALRNNSLHFLATNFKTDDLSVQYECAWRLNSWNLDETNQENEKICIDYEKYHYFALKSLHDMDQISTNSAIIQARNCVIKNLAHASLESSKNLYSPLTQLQMLQEIENFAEAKTAMTLNDLLAKWKSQKMNKNEFDYIEPICAQRITMANDIFLNEDVDLVKSFLADMYLQLAGLARTEGFYHVAQRSLNNLSNMSNLTSVTKGQILFEQAQLAWLNDKASGRYLLRHLLDSNDSINQKLYGEALRLYGNWMVETRSENPTTIIENYFQKSLNVLNEFQQTQKDIENQCETLDSLARFADSQYQQVSSYIKSSSFVSKVQTIAKFRRMYEQIFLQSQPKTTDQKKALALYDKQSRIDENEVNNAYKEEELYLTLAVKCYLRILENCDLYNLKVFRILSLILENKTNKSLLTILKMSLPKIASYKYVPLLPQLVPHIGNTIPNDLFEKIVQDLLEQCSIDHPHHTLPIILGLSDSYKDRNYEVDNNSETVEARVNTAKEILIRLKKKKHLTRIIKNMELLSSALISLAYLDASSCQQRKQHCIIPRSESIKSIRNFDNILIPTINLDVRKSRNYENVVGIADFEGNFSMVGGINAPKKIICLGTDGIKRTQLVKGKDDLRQDAVMQQVFSIMNTLLAKNKQTSKLLIRTYKVVPLSQRSGVIEWCENTEPLGIYLNEAHKKYHPTDWSPTECRNQLKAVHSSDHDSKYRVYKEICSKFRPVFHMFFISSYPQPTVWFERRRAYTRSVATSSMIGYILGLGDRHVQNILLDKNTGEVIHIDFGIAFEQGKTLPTPETVPFRLTRDIESGMGICGIEGVFRRSCEKTMQVLRQNAETVLTILEVLLYDPLYVWTITPAEAYSRQCDEDSRSYNLNNDDVTSVNVTAERALTRLKQKLQGTENGGVCSVEGQVELLLQQARDPVNLSRLYVGWQAYL